MCEEYPELEIPDDAEIDRLLGCDPLSDDEIDLLLDAINKTAEEAGRVKTDPLTEEEVRAFNKTYKKCAYCGRYVRKEDIND